MFVAGWLVLPAFANHDSPEFLVISDIHFDPFADPHLFDALHKSPAAAWYSIFEAGAKTSFSQAGSDSNFALLRSSLDDARKRMPDPDFVLYGGDFLAHGWQDKYDALAPVPHAEDPVAYRSFTSKVLHFLAEMFRERFPDVPIFATLGNEDAYCGDYQLEPGGAFLEQFANVWGPLIGDRGYHKWKEKILARGGYYSVRLPWFRASRLVVLNTVFFSNRYQNSCGRSDQTPALDQLRWLARTLQTAALRGEEVWLLMHVPPGIDGYATERNIEKGATPASFWQRELTSQFVQLASQHRRRLRISFSAHTHMDDYRMIRLEAQPLLLNKIVPGVSPVFGNDPGYQVYEFSDSQRLKNLDFETIRLTNLATGSSGNTDPGDWQREYGFSDAYGFGPLGVAAVTRLAHALYEDDITRSLYTSFYPVGAKPLFDDTTIDIYRCALLNLTTSEFEHCFNSCSSVLFRQPCVYQEITDPYDVLAGDH
jgi:sphingomyelin phosphodiesterase acid-like 3